MTTQQIYIDFVDKLRTLYDHREADQIADWVFENVTGLKRWERKGMDHQELPDAHFAQLNRNLDELLRHRPVQYVLEEAWFYKMKFYVNEEVLIPRPETEELVEWILDDLKDQQGGDLRVMDMGTGSGCIAVAIKKNWPEAAVSAVEISEKAIQVARRNARQLAADIHFEQLDFLKEDKWPVLELYDVIVSNPPYIPSGERKSLSRVVTDWEPAAALFVDNEDPLLFYKKIIGFAATHLKTSGTIYVETHEDYARYVKELFDQSGLAAKLKKDIYGKERMVKATRENASFLQKQR